jgi:tripartite-type tricarboxylate transporter receptor subunit TctC
MMHSRLALGVLLAPALPPLSQAFAQGKADAYPEIPTMREQGLNRVVGQGLFVPKGTPQPVISKLFSLPS